MPGLAGGLAALLADADVRRRVAAGGRVPFRLGDVPELLGAVAGGLGRAWMVEGLAQQTSGPLSAWAYQCVRAGGGGEPGQPIVGGGAPSHPTGGSWPSWMGALLVSPATGETTASYLSRIAGRYGMDPSALLAWWQWTGSRPRDASGGFRDDAEVLLNISGQQLLAQLTGIEPQDLVRALPAFVDGPQAMGRTYGGCGAWPVAGRFVRCAWAGGVRVPAVHRGAYRARHGGRAVRGSVAAGVRPPPSVDAHRRRRAPPP